MQQHNVASAECLERGSEDVICLSMPFSGVSCDFDSNLVQASRDGEVNVLIALANSVHIYDAGFGFLMGSFHEVLEACLHVSSIACLDSVCLHNSHNSSHRAGTYPMG